MPPYAPHLFLSAVRCSSSLRRNLIVGGVRRTRRRWLIYRSASTSTSAISCNASRNVLDGQDETQNSNPLRRVLSVLESASRLRGKAVSGPEVPLEPLVEACDELSTVEGRRNIRLSLHSEEDALAQALVNVLLDDPLFSDSSLRSAIRDRRSTGRSFLRFRRTGSKPPEDNVATLPSPFFDRFPHPVILEELRSPSLSPGAISRLLEADVPITIASPLHSPSPFLLFAISQNPHTLLVIDGALDPTSPGSDRLRSQISDKYRCDASRVLLVDTTRALRGAAALSTGPSSAPAVRAFQDDVLASGIPGLLNVLTDTVSLGPARLNADTKSALTKCALTAAKDVVHLAKEETRDVRGRSSALYEEALEARERAGVEILGGDTDVVVQGEQGRVAKGVERVAVDLRPVLDGLTWYRLPFVVDDVSVRIDSAVERTFAKEFENELIFHTGRLSYLQSYFVSRTNSLLSSLPPAFHSPVLQNTIAQITSSPSFPITPSSSLNPSSSSSAVFSNSNPPPALLTPLRTRTAQLTHATRSLHLTAQRLLLFTFTSTTLSSLSSALLYVHLSIDGPTSIGFGLLTTLLSLRWAVGKWTRAKEKWWGAYRRVGEGLERDLSVVLGGMLDRQVCAVPSEACMGLQRIVEKREREIGEVGDQVEEFEVGLQSLGNLKEEEKRKEKEAVKA